MGVSVCCSLAEDNHVEAGIESLIVKSFNSGKDGVKTHARSVSFNGRDLESSIMKALGSGKMKREASISFNGKDLEKMISIMAPRSDNPTAMNAYVPSFDPNNPKHEAATKLQKVYKSFRTRRKLADCAVLVEQSWWKLLDFAQLKRSSVSFFEMEKHESAISRWSRARTRVAKVGKGLSKNDKARKLALQHWLEAIDPRHRYGHNLHLYYVNWLHSRSREPFFYWLDIGEGKEVNLEKCPRLKLQQQCIKYLGPMEREDYEVILEEGKFLYKKAGEVLDTTREEMEAKRIFVLSTSKNLYVGKKKKGKFQHSSFLAGGATSSAGRLIIENGVLKAVWPHSGHYRPTEENFRDFLSFLRENNVDLADVKMSPDDDKEKLLNKQKNQEIELSDEDSIQKTNDSDVEVAIDEESMYEKSDFLVESPVDDHGISGYLAFPKPNKIDEQIGENEDERIQADSIYERIHSRNGMKTYQLGKQLSSKWTTGAGPRISCVRDYPPELQVRALEHVSLSPRSTTRSTVDFPVN